MMEVMDTELGRQRLNDLREQACRQRQVRVALEGPNASRRRGSLLRRKPETC